MANKSLFQTVVGRLMPQTDTVNEAGGRAYKLTPEQALAQYVITGCLNKTFYADEGEQLKTVLELCDQVDAKFIVLLARYAREKGYMKDMPALLCAVLSVRDPELLKKVFFKVIDNAKMLRNYVQIMRSGVVGRKSLGTLPRKLVREWLARHSDDVIFKASVGNSPSMKDVIKMVHPKPETKKRDALYGYMIGKNVEKETLPDLVQRYEDYKQGQRGEVPDVPFQMLTSLQLSTNEWKGIARNAKWQMTRMNLNTFARHGVFEDKKITKVIANRLANAELVRKAKVFPYQIMKAYTMTNSNVPFDVREALQDAMEVALENVPRIKGKVIVCPDVSGSMSWSATGYRQGATSKVRCIDVAALVAAAFLRTNRDAMVLPFEHDVVSMKLNARDSVMTNAEKLSSIGGGGTNCSAPLSYLNRYRKDGDLVIYVSDNESWIDTRQKWRRAKATETMTEWKTFKKRNPRAKLVLIDIAPSESTQAVERDDILNIGGFSDQVFKLIAEFAAGRMDGDHLVGLIKSMDV